jgi:hypothetical protein
MTETAGKFVEGWVCANVTNVPGLEDLPREIERLACLMTADARDAGISGREIERAVGDIDEFLTRAYENKKPAAFAAGF